MPYINHANPFYFDRIGRKKTVVGNMILAGIACFSVALIPGGTERTG